MNALVHHTIVNFLLKRVHYYTKFNLPKLSSGKMYHVSYDMLKMNRKVVNSAGDTAAAMSMARVLGYLWQDTTNKVLCEKHW